MSTDPQVHMVTDEELSPEAEQLFQQMRDKSGDVPKWMKVMGNCPDILTGFFSMFKATMDDAPLPSQLKWKVAYKVSELNRCDYCVDVTSQKLQKFGFAAEQLASINEYSDDREKSAIEYAEQTTKHAFKVDAELMNSLKEKFSDEELVELTAVVGLFNYINRFNDALGVLPD